MQKTKCNCTCTQIVEFHCHFLNQPKKSSTNYYFCYKSNFVKLNEKYTHRFCLKSPIPFYFNASLWFNFHCETLFFFFTLLFYATVQCLFFHAVSQLFAAFFLIGNVSCVLIYSRRYELLFRNTCTYIWIDNNSSRTKKSPTFLNRFFFLFRSQMKM